MYEKIRSMDSLPTSYANQLMRDGIVKEQAYKKMIDQTVNHFEEEFKES